MMKRIVGLVVDGEMLREMPHSGCMYSVKGTLNEMGLSLEQCSMLTRVSNDWRRVVYNFRLHLHLQVA